MSAQQSHQQKVQQIAGLIADQVTRGQRVHITRSSAVHHVVPLPDDPRFRDRPVDISGLDEILQIDAAARRCIVEPGVSFARLARATLEHGLLPRVVPELEGITVGGAVAGCSIEGMSYRFGGFHDSCTEYELITGDGRVLTCSPEKDPETFHIMHGSYGTLAILTRITCKLVPALPYVELQYRHSHNLDQFRQELHARCEAADFDFIDGIIHGPDHFVVCLGRFVEEAPYTSDYRREKLYYKSTARLNRAYMTTEDYCFRYDAECHWLTRRIPPLEWAPVRRAIGKWALGSTNLISWANRLAPVMSLKRRPEVVCDVFIPSGNFERFFRWYERDFRFYPLWIVPYRVPHAYPWVDDEYGRELMEAMPDRLLIDCAVYGKPNSERRVDYSQLLEQKTHELRGVKTLISRNHYTPESFWQVYNRKNFAEAKARLDPAGVLPELCETFHSVGN